MNHLVLIALISFASLTTPVLSAICGNGIVEGTEQCDGGYMCTAGCTCPSNLMPDGGNGCVCIAALPMLHGHWFSAPPTLDAAIDTVDATIQINVTLSQVSPVRSLATAVFVNPIDGSSLAIPVPIAMVDNGCQQFGTWTNALSYMLQHCGPEITKTATSWIFGFAIKVSWLEVVQLTKKGGSVFANRTMNSRLSLSLVVDRFATASSNITVLSPGLLWAYISKSFIMFDGVNTYVDLEIVTHTKSDGLTINIPSFVLTGFTGTDIVSITGPTFVNYELTNGLPDQTFQIWSFRVYLLNALCTTTINDNFTLAYTIVTTVPGDPLPPRSGTMTLTLYQMENWCAVNTTHIGLQAVQKTYIDHLYTSQATLFGSGDVVYVVVSVTPDVALDLSATTLDYAMLTGPALSGSYVIPSVLYNSTYTDTTVFFFNAIGGPGSPAICQATNSTCYSFQLAPMLHTNLLITIKSSVTITLVTGKRRSLVFEKTATLSKISLGTPSTQGTTEATQMPTVMVQYAASPGYLAAIATAIILPLASLAVIAYVIIANRRKN